MIMAIEQLNDVFRQQLKPTIFKDEHPETILQQDTRYQHYSRQIDRLSITDKIITRHYFHETGQIKFNQVLISETLHN